LIDLTDEELLEAYRSSIATHNGRGKLSQGNVLAQPGRNTNAYNRWTKIIASPP